MRQLIDGYRWLWRSVVRWRGGTVLRSVPIFLAYVVVDVARGGGRRLRVGLLSMAAAAVMLSIVLRPVDYGEHIDVSLGPSSLVELEGSRSSLVQLDEVLRSHDIRSVTLHVNATVSAANVFAVMALATDYGLQRWTIDVLQDG
jgi:hypothetical protein